MCGNFDLIMIEYKGNYFGKGEKYGSYNCGEAEPCEKHNCGHR